MITASERFEIMQPHMRPQDESMDGAGLTFETLEHGGEYPDAMPQAIKVTDAEGRWCIYVPTEYRGEVVRHHGFEYHDDGLSGAHHPSDESGAAHEPVEHETVQEAA